MAFCDRLREKRVERGFTQQKVADLVGITKGAYSGYEIGRREPDVIKIKKLAEILNTTGDFLLETGFDEPNQSSASPETETRHLYPRTSAVTQLYTEHYNKYTKLDEYGRMAVDAVTDVELERTEYDNKSNEKAKHSDIIGINLSEQSASAGTGVSLDVDSFVQIDVIRNNLTDKAIFAVPVRGDSMTPEFNNGDIILVSRETPSIGDYGVFTLNGEGYLKELGEGVLISLNDSYSDIEMNESARCNGKVIGVLDPSWIVK